MRALPVSLLLPALVCVACASTPRGGTEAAVRLSPPLPIERPAGETAEWWYRSGALRAQDRRQGPGSAKNVILFVGDGMSLTTVAATRILEGQRRGQPGEENMLAFESFPNTALSRTYNTDSQTPDSAGTMTAMATGVKTRIGVLDIAPSVARGDCVAALRAPLVSALEIAEAAGLSTGIVTTTRLTHATPAATYAHAPDRNWENDADVPDAARQAGCRDIASQFVEFSAGDGIEVALAGGRSHFLPAGADDPEYAEFPGDRLDGRHLIDEWRAKNPNGAYVWNAKQLAVAEAAQAPRLLGLFEPDHMQFEQDRPGDRAGEPSLAEMTRAAIGVLRRNPRGYFLMVEGGRIDHAHHNGNAYRALTDTIAFSDAVRAAAELTSEDDTLILVTADHSHTLNFAGYPKRGNPILGKVVGSSGEDGTPGVANDALGLPYTTLSYLNGPGYAGATDQQPEGPKRYPHELSGVQQAARRPNLREVDTEHPDYLQDAMFPMRSETHAGDDVGVWARGPGAGAVRGSIEQNTIFHLMVQATPALREWLCQNAACEAGVPVAPVAADALRKSAR